MSSLLPKPPKADSIHCDPADAGYVLQTLARCEDVCQSGWTNNTVYWTVDVPAGEVSAANLRIRRKLEQAISTHRPA